MDARSGRWELCWANRKMPGLRGAAGRLFEAAVPSALAFTSPRAWAFSVLGMQAYLERFPGDRAIQGVRNTLANRLLDIYERSLHQHIGDGLRKACLIRTQGCLKHLSLPDGEAITRRMVEAGIERSSGLSPRSIVAILRYLSRRLQRILP